MRDYKIVFVGCSGCGKTTAISSVSDIPMVLTEVTNMDNEYNKKTTTVGLDYGEVVLPGKAHLFRLYGVPGQQRFSFMWDILRKGAVGIIFLADNSRSDPLGELRNYLSVFNQLNSDHVSVLGIVKSDISPYPDKTAYEELLRQENQAMPIMYVDARDKSSVLLLIKVLSQHLEKKINHQQ